MYLNSSKICLITFLILEFGISTAFVPVVSSASVPFAISSNMAVRKNKFYQNQSPAGTISIRGGETKIHSSFVEFQNGPFWQSAAIFTAVNALGWIISLLTGSHLHLDLLGSGAFALAGLPSLVGKSISDIGSSRTQLSGAMMTLWGAKLAGFLFFRALKTGHDGRLDDLLSSASGATSFWFVSLLWGLLCSLPHALGTTSSAAGAPMTTRIGAVLYAIGITFETLADLQKWNFKQLHPKEFCNVGVWSLSQHPNWFGNLLLWSGIFLINAPALLEHAPSSGDPSSFLQRIWGAKRLLIALLSPLFLWSLFSGQAKGSITPALELANKKYGNDPNYQKYISEVPLIFPNPMKWFTSK